MNKYFYILSFFLLIFQKSIAQKTWTLDECISYAMTHNLDSKSNSLDVEKNKENLRQSVRDFLPSITSSTGYNVGFGRFIDPNTNNIIDTQSFSNSYSIGASVELFNGFRKWNSMKQKSLQHKISKQNSLNAKYNLAFSIMDAYYNVQFKKGQLQIVKEQQELSAINYKTVASKVALGLLAKSDLYDIESTKASDALEVLRAENDLKEAQLDLTQQMNLEQNTINLQPELAMASLANEIKSLQTDSIFNNALNFLPDYKNSELQVKVSKKGVAISRSGLFPNISFNSGISTGYYETQTDPTGNIIPFRDQFKNNTSKSISFSLSLPIFNKWSNRSQIKLAKIEVLKAKNNLDQKKQEIYKEIQAMVQKSNALQLEKEMQTATHKAKELSYTIARKKFDKGLITIYNLQEAINEFTKTKMEQLRVDLQLIIQKRTVDFYNGLDDFRINIQ